jgi:RNA polymerase-binding transcription factor DksA
MLPTLGQELMIMPTPDASLIAVHKAALEARLADLGIRLSSIEEELVSHSDPDWGEMAIEREGDEVLEATGVAGELEVRQIQAALSRIAAGNYGVCTRCGSEISQARLQALPETPFCKECAA